MGMCCITQGTQTGALEQSSGTGCGEKWEGTHVYLWLIHVDV